MDKKLAIKKHYKKLAEKSSCSCCGDNKKAKDIAEEIGYGGEEIGYFKNANLGLGCGNPLGMSEIKEGDTVLDLGSGAGFDAFIASQKVGREGCVIGVDMTEEMINVANENKQYYDVDNVEFVQGDIENLPIDDDSVDIAITNCVINLSSDKNKVFKEVHRVLKNKGKFYISDIVLTQELPEDVRNNEELLVGCVAGAVLKDKYLDMIESAGFSVRTIKEDSSISKSQYKGMPVMSIQVEAVKYY